MSIYQSDFVKHALPSVVVPYQVGEHDSLNMFCDMNLITFCAREFSIDGCRVWVLLFLLSCMCVTSLQVLDARILPTPMPFEGESTTRTTYTVKSSVSAALVVPSATTTKRTAPCTASDPLFGHLSTYAAAFIAHPVSARVIPPQVLAARMVPPTLPFEGESTCHREFGVPSASVVDVRDVKTEPERAAGDHVSTHMSTYVAHIISPRPIPPQVLAARVLPSPTPFEGQSTYQSDFRAHSALAAVDVVEEIAVRHPTPQMEEDYMSTHMAAYVTHSVCPRPIPPQVLAARALPTTLPFEGESTYHRDFRAPSSWEADISCTTEVSDVPSTTLSSAASSESSREHCVPALQHSMSCQPQGDQTPSFEEQHLSMLSSATPASAPIVVQHPELLPGLASESAIKVDSVNASASSCSSATPIADINVSANADAGAVESTTVSASASTCASETLGSAVLNDTVQPVTTATSEVCDVELNASTKTDPALCNGMCV
jgi:hypothetical protein